MDIEDPIADALLGDSAYDRVRMARWRWFRQSIPRKLTLQSYLLFLLAAILPVVGFLPAAVRDAYLSGAAVATPKVALVALVATLVVAGTGLGHVAVGIRRVVLEPDLTEQQAAELLNVEGVCSLLGFLTGGVAILATYGFVALGFGGLEFLQSYIAAGGGNPFATSAVGIDVASVAVLALVSGVSLRVLATYVWVETLRVSLTNGAAAAA
jgi:hypothetical protein